MTMALTKTKTNTKTKIKNKANLLNILMTKMRVEVQGSFALLTYSRIETMICGRPIFPLDPLGGSWSVKRTLSKPTLWLLATSPNPTSLIQLPECTIPAPPPLSSLPQKNYSIVLFSILDFWIRFPYLGNEKSYWKSADGKMTGILRAFQIFQSQLNIYFCWSSVFLDSMAMSHKQKSYWIAAGSKMTRNFRAFKIDIEIYLSRGMNAQRRKKFIYLGIFYFWTQCICLCHCLLVGHWLGHAHWSLGLYVSKVTCLLCWYLLS